MGATRRPKDPISGRGAGDEGCPRASDGAGAAPHPRDLSSIRGVIGDLHRLYEKLDVAQTRLVGELVDKQIKIARILLERFAQEELLAKVERLEASNRELEAKLAGGASGNSATRADAAPAFVLPPSGIPH